MTPEDAAEIYTMRLEAELHPRYEHRCIFGEKVFYVATERALTPGQIYSIEGMHEYERNSHCCEFHFDAMFEERESV